RRRRQREADAGRDAGDPPQGRVGAERDGHAARRLADRGRVPQARRHLAVCVTGTDGRLTQALPGENDMPQDTFKTLRDFTPSPGKKGRYHALAALEQAGLGKMARLPRSILVVLEALVRHCDGKLVTEDHVKALAAWQANGK